MEAQLGFLSAISMAGIVPEANSNYCVWDSGGASFQITYKNYSNGLNSEMNTYMGSIGTSVALKIFLEEVRGATMSRPTDSSQLINPINQQECDLYITKIISKLSNNIPIWLQNRELVIAASGSNSLFKLCCIILNIEKSKTDRDTKDTIESIEIDHFSLQDAEYVLNLCLNKTDEELLKYQQFPYAEGTHVIIPKLALLIAVLRHAGIKYIHSVGCIGCCAGVICEDRFWSLIV